LLLKYDVIHKTGSTYQIALSSDRDRASATGNIRRKRDDVFEIREKTGRQTYTLIAIFRILPVDEQSAIIMG